ncbi:MAG: hypothetical protein KDI31_06720 [Pseudomonadales bacterium]|nr:hypothetical protein [Pseudomonadales bacterium]
MHRQRARRSAPAHHRLIPLLLGWMVTLEAQAATPIQAELSGPFHEVVQEEVSVSGTVVVGVAAAGALSGPATLAGLIMPTSAGQICLTVLSRDGVYYSRNSYNVPEGSPTEGDILVQLPFEGTRRRELLAGYAEGELAVLATPCACDAATTTYLVAGGPTEVKAVDILINSFGANTVYYRTAEGFEADCTEFTEGRRTSFDYRCEIPAAALGSGRQALTIERERYGRPLGQVAIELQLRTGS